MLTSSFQDSFRHFSGLFVNSFAWGKLFEVKRLWKPFYAKCFFFSLKLMYCAGLVNCEGYFELNNLGSCFPTVLLFLNIPILVLLLLIKRDSKLFFSFEFWLYVLKNWTKTVGQSKGTNFSCKEPLKGCQQVKNPLVFTAMQSISWCLGVL